MLKGGCGVIPHPLFFRRRASPLHPWLAALAAIAVLTAPCAADVVFEAVPAAERWPRAVEADALRLACSASRDELEGRFRQEGLPYRPDLLRVAPGRVCHLFYRPTVSGFRAAPDDEPLKELLFDSDSLLYLSTQENHGEPVGAMREVLRHIVRPLEATVLLHRDEGEAAYDEATRRAFGSTPHKVTVIERGQKENFWWVQDYLKAGRSARGETILVSHRLFEGRPENGAVFEPLLERLSSQPRMVRSRLSWEGGDLQFTRDPRDPRRLLLYYGTFAKPYWGESLSPAEFEYVLGLEFGADRGVDLSGLAPHVDYFASFLPAARTVLVSVPRSGDLEVARAAAAALLGRFAGREPDTLVELGRRLSSLEPDRSRVARLLEQARKEHSSWSFTTDSSLAERMKALVARVCPGARDCFSTGNQEHLREADPRLFEEWLHAVQYAKDEPKVVSAHLDLVESQLEPVPGAVVARTAEKTAALQALGFRVIEVPALRVDLRSPHEWPGISYVNGLVVDQQVFVPRFGLGEVEDRIFRELGAALPPGYTVVPVYAQRVLIRNGGLHCLAGLVRSASP